MNISPNDDVKCLMNFKRLNTKNKKYLQILTLFNKICNIEKKLHSSTLPI
ncbi:Uncharacterised protein [Sphingobacterium multivorum]|uniref:Uncharacterized protein n=1 Tax=Sphingobacterium multivorum TaxID=28454 RepID=A0A654CR99_SPHMU|nr:Uncharacterised protein [Sphingobacterium multivorum]VXC96116.1 conserved hypothetical protein [Sphingobacterium multivorum]